MAEYLDVYDANRKHIGTADRNVVHKFGLWHKTVHCWMLWENKLVFQRRSRNLDANAGKLYTTASGHVSTGETLADAFTREISEEIGLDPKSLNPKHLYETVWIADIKRKDGSLFVDRVFANVYYAKYDGALTDFKFDDGEVDSVVAIDLKSVTDFLYGKTREVIGTEFDGKNIAEITLTVDDFVVNDGEILLDKYGKIADGISADING